MIRRLIPLVLLLACKRSSSPSPPLEPVTPPASDAAGDGAVAAAPDLPPPSEALSAPPDELAAHVRLEPFVSGLERPVALVAAPGDARHRLFVVEQVGRLRMIEGGVLSPAVLLDMHAQVSHDNEQGLLGLAFHPKFATNRTLYLDYTDTGGDTHVIERRLTADGDRVDAAGGREILKVKQPYSNHNGGNLVFGPDGKLWVGLGDGGAAGDPNGNGQNDGARLGKMLRIDVDADPPVVEVVAKGLRNPWRYSFDAATGDLYIGDVGQNTWEQLYVVPHDHLTGHNFGWNVAEGRHCFEHDGCDRSAFTPPVTDYKHDVGCSVTGGFVYRGKAIPALDGVYFYADYCTAFIRSFRWGPDGIRQHWDWKPVFDPNSTMSQISTFGVDQDGEIYVVSLGGDISRVTSH